MDPERRIQNEYLAFRERELDEDQHSQLFESSDAADSIALVFEAAFQHSNEPLDRALDTDDYQALGELASEEGIEEAYAVSIARAARDDYRERVDAIDTDDLPRDQHRSAEGIEPYSGPEQGQAREVVDPLRYDDLATAIRDFSVDAYDAGDVF